MLAVEAIKAALRQGSQKRDFQQALRNVLAAPEEHRFDDIYGPLAEELVRERQKRTAYLPRQEPATYHQWGDDLDAGSVQQMDQACALPISFRGALMADAHQGYGLPIGGVLAVEGAVIPYAVGMDIGCRMKLSVLDWPVDSLQQRREELIRALEKETRFGVGAKFTTPRQHEVMDDDWSVSPVTQQFKDHAWRQLGTSGSGNHFVEFGILTVQEQSLDLERGEYLALLSHSGARGTGAEVAKHYSRQAMELHPELPKELQRLSWLDLASPAGQEYWQAMELMGRYSSANHELIHRHIVRALGARIVADVENHHNFAWKERHFDRDVVVHRKGATPASEGTLGVIPGSMGTPGYVVRGLGEPDSLCSASHGAGRLMSRKAAKARFTWAQAREFLQQRQVELLSAGLDEVPMAYKDIETVMEAQQDLVHALARFDPRLVKMAPSGVAPRNP
jgi:tRNA-splicing ligase RtcB